MAKVAKSDFPQEQWNKKRLIIFGTVLMFLVIGGLEFKSYILGQDLKTSVKSASISPVPTISLPSYQSIGRGVENNLGNIKQEISKMNVTEIATSSPQIQKIINDIKNLPAVPGQQAKSICLQLCNGL